MARTRVTRDDIHGKLREAKVIELSEVYAVVLESTGDISVLHGSDTKPLDKRFLEGVATANYVSFGTRAQHRENGVSSSTIIAKLKNKSSIFSFQDHG